jgi:hypothetical protein
MKAIKAKFDGRRIILPPGLKVDGPREVIVIFDDANGDVAESGWARAQQDALQQVWDNPEDAEYDKL